MARAKHFPGLLLIAMSLSGCMTASRAPTTASVRYELAAWSQLPGWSIDQQQEAWSAFLYTCKVWSARPPWHRLEWKNICEAAQSQTDTADGGARAFFEARLSPYRIIRTEGRAHTVDTGLVTGYYEPLLRGARERSALFSVPLYAPPTDMLTVEMSELYPELKGKRVRGRLQGTKVVPYFSRAELVDNPGLRGQEIVWVDDAVAAFFLEVQGSGRVQLEDGQTIRLGYADQNGHPYRSIGRYLVDRGEMTLEQTSAQSIRRWIELHPQRLRELLDMNPSVVFFREERIEDPRQGPRGALGVPLTAGRSIAVDPTFVPLGAPVFLATTQPDSQVPLQRLVLAQDTGGAIRGMIRADLFWGFGGAAGDAAGRMRQQGRMWLLWPRGAPAPMPPP